MIEIGDATNAVLQQESLGYQPPAPEINAPTPRMASRHKLSKTFETEPLVVGKDETKRSD